MRLSSNHFKLRSTQTTLLLSCVLVGSAIASADNSELQSKTAASFDRYVHATEARMDDDLRYDAFLIVDRLPETHRQKAYEQLQRGQIYIEELHAREDGRTIAVPGGHIHHWAAVIFIPKATLSAALAVLQDYDNDPIAYKPQIRRSKLIERNGNDSKIYFQLFNDSVVTVVLNANFDVSDTPFGSTRYQIVSRSTRIVEVDDIGKPNERERPMEKNHGYMWRLYCYWRAEGKKGGVFVQIESIVLSRSSPAVVAWLVNPVTKKIPRDILFHLLTDTRTAVMAGRSR